MALAISLPDFRPPTLVAVWPVPRSGNERLPGALINTQELAIECFRLGAVRDGKDDRYQTVIHRELHLLPRAARAEGVICNLQVHEESRQFAGCRRGTTRFLAAARNDTCCAARSNVRHEPFRGDAAR
jgi:hypothetical protein